MADLRKLEMYSVQEVAELVRVSDRTVWRELKKGHLRATQFGGQWRISADDLRDYLESRTNRRAAVAGA